MTATLPSSLTWGHYMTTAEWNQIITALRCMSNITPFNYTGTITFNTTSTAYVSVTNALCNFTKLYDSSTSDVGIMHLGAARTTSAGQISFGVLFNGVDRNVSHHFCNSVGKHYYQGGFVRLAGQPASTYSVQTRVKTAAGTLNIDSNDYISGFVIELPK